MSTKVYGASDDLIEFEGDVYGEVGHYFDGKRPVKVTMSDGTELLVIYGKRLEPDARELGIWWIRCKKAGPLFERIDECFNEDGKPYSDVAWFKDGLTGARCKGKVVR